VSLSFPDSTKSFLAIYAGVCVCLVPSVASADAGIPMLVLVWPGAWLALLPVVLVEALVARRLLRLRFGRSLRVALVANLVSTGVGIPVTWLGLVLVEMLGALGIAGTTVFATDFESDRWFQLAFFPFMAAWLPDSAPWMVVAAAIVLCVPFYFVSVWLEFLVARRFLPEFERVQVKRWSRIANAVSYGLIVLGLLGYMLYLLRR
jgi:hypothetical protein